MTVLDFVRLLLKAAGKLLPRTPIGAILTGFKFLIYLVFIGFSFYVFELLLSKGGVEGSGSALLFLVFICVAAALAAFFVWIDFKLMVLLRERTVQRTRTNRRSSVEKPGT